MKIEKINISEITEYENNAKLHPREQIEQIKKSIQEFGNNDPIAIDENNVIIEGHGRYKALQELGYDEVEVIRLSHMDDEQKRAYILAHNKLTMNSGFDIELLNSELESIVNIDTMKPLKLIERLVRNSSKKGWNVLDSFNGSGSTMIVCEDLGRTYFGMELDPRYVDATIQRWEEHTGQTAVKLN